MDLPSPPKLGPPGLSFNHVHVMRWMTDWQERRRPPEEDVLEMSQKMGSPRGWVQRRSAFAAARERLASTSPSGSPGAAPSSPLNQSGGVLNQSGTGGERDLRPEASDPAVAMAGAVQREWPKAMEGRYIAPRMLKHCVVCGRTEDAGAPLELREQGFKCVGADRRNACVGRPANPRLQPPGADTVGGTEGGWWGDARSQLSTLEGQLGQFGDVIGMRRANDQFSKGHARQTEALVVFRRPAAWVSSDACRRLADHLRKAPLQTNKREELPDPKLFVSRDRLPFWDKLMSNVGFSYLPAPINQQAVLDRLTNKSLIDTEDEWVAIQLHSDIPVWLPVPWLTKVGEFWQDYVRVGDVNTVRDAAFTKWEEWWEDFTLCVGRVREMQRVVKGEEARFHAVIDFEASATITFPTETLRACSWHDFEVESLFVPLSIPERRRAAVFVAHPIILMTKTFFLLAFFIYSLAKAASEGHGGSLSGRSTWLVYQELYFRLFNSGFPTLMADFGTLFVYRVFMQDISARSVAIGLGRPTMVCVGIAAGVCVPGFLTHCIPMIIYYLWLWIPMTVFVNMLLRRLKKLEPRAPPITPDRIYDRFHYRKHHKTYMAKITCFFIFFRLCAEFFLVILVQTNYNYGIIKYAGEHEYLETISVEYTRRAVDCNFEKAFRLATQLW